MQRSRAAEYEMPRLLYAAIRVGVWTGATSTRHCGHHRQLVGRHVSQHVGKTPRCQYPASMLLETAVNAIVDPVVRRGSKARARSQTHDFPADGKEGAPSSSRGSGADAVVDEAGREVPARSRIEEG